MSSNRAAPPGLPDGLHDLPPGKIAAVATYLEMRAAPEATPIDLRDGRLEPIAGDVSRYRALYRAVGEPWLWFSRASLPEAELAGIVRDPSVDAFAFVRDGIDAGIVELDFRRMPDCELAFFGLVPGLIGRGIGRNLIAEAVQRAFAKPIDRLWVHTCTLDHPAALGLYRRAGFRPYRRAVEIADDPRLDGRLPRGSADGFPVLV